SECAGALAEVRMRRRIWMAGGFLSAVLAACGSSVTGIGEEGAMTEAESSGMRPASAPASPPEGAIDVGRGVYMVPVSTTTDGCVQYTPWSATAAVVTAIHYRRADGSFTTNREEAADCPS
ncbi:MAG: hypothetical protein KDH19_12560, partial [Geminicoccaceae bacterium]|nr:hypothetical protein [Geminicoccaceae bacterium]